MPVHTFPVSHRAVSALAARNNPRTLGLGALALQNGLALTNPFLGIALTKKQRHAKAIQKETLYRNKYMECRQRAAQKGKAVYPEGKACKTKWKRWQKWRGKAGIRAMKVAERAEKKGRLDPEAKAFLDADMQRAMLVDANQALSMAAAGGTDADLVLAENYSVENEMPWMTIAAVGGLGLAVLGGGWVLLRK